MIFDISERRKKEVNDKEKKEWVRLPLKCLQDSDISVYDTIVLAVILDYVDGESKAMSIEKIMQKTGLSDRQIQRSIKALVKAEYITAERRAGKKTVYTQCGVLPPKRQSQKKPQPYKPKGTDYYNKPKSTKELKIDELRMERYGLLMGIDFLEQDEQDRRWTRMDEIDEEIRRLQA